MKAIFLRELHSYFISPIGYVYLATFYLLAGYQYTLIILKGQADMSVEFSFLYTVVVLLTPLLTMRLLSEEKKQKTDQLLFSSPITLNAIVAGKFFAAVFVYILGILVTFIQALLLSPYANINWMTFWGSFAGIIFVGMACIAVCMFVSSQTENQVISAIGGFAIMMFIMSLNSLAQMIDFVPLKNALCSISFYSRYYNMTMGIFKISDIFFFLSLSGVFYFLTIRVLEKKRWN